MDALKGRTIRGYEIGERIGVGGFGAVYRAYQPAVDREVAIKVILPEHAVQPEFIRRFEAEAQVIARLEHPHIVPLYDYWQDAEGAFLVMRYLGGGSLRIRLAQGAWEAVAVANLLDQIAAALALAHRQTVIHRDMKPDNILQDAEGNAYLSDFGIARIMSRTTRITQDNAVMGSPAYLAPEQIAGEPVTAQTDLYSLGIVLYELLTGEHPFGNVNPMVMLIKQQNEPLPLLQDRRPDLPHEFDTVIQRATMKNPSGRYPDALALARAFRQAFPPARAQETVILDGRRGVSTRNLGMVSDLKGKFYEKAGNILDNPRRFVGRDTLILEVHHLLDSGEQVLLAGMGGIGKTALAAHIAADRIDAGKGPVIWLEAGEEDADTLFEALARTFDQHQRVAGTIGDERVTVVRELLAEKQAMLVLDNVWDERALFRVMRAIPPGMAVLVTSRHMIPLDGVVLPVSELGPEHALALLSHHARQDYRGDDQARLLCRRLGYHPFALEIAGKQLKVQPHLSPGQLLANIGTAPHTLTIPGAFADAGRAGLQDVLDSSVKELDDAAYGVFVRLGGLFVPVATIELLAMLLQSETQTVQAALVDLQQRGLAEIAQPDNGLPHYRIHDLTYSYARTLFEEEGCDRRTAVAAVQHYVFDHAHDFDHLDFEQANILGAARAAKQLGADVTLIAIMWVMLAEGYLDARGHTPRLLKRADDAIAAARQMQPDQDETLHFMLGKRGNAYADRGDLDRALEMYQSALELAPNPQREAILLSGIGTIRIRQGEDDYDRYFEQAEQIATINHDDIVLAQVLEERGTSALFRGEYEVAYQFLDRSVVFAERLGDVKRLFLSLYNLGVVEVELGHFTQALSLQKRSHQIAEAANNSRWIASALSGAARAYHGLGERDKAQTYFRQALRRYQEFGATDTVAWILEFMQKEAYSTDIEDQIMADS